MNIWIISSLAIGNKAGMNIHIQVFIFRIGIAGLF